MDCHAHHLGISEQEEASLYFYDIMTCITLSALKYHFLLSQVKSLVTGKRETTPIFEKG